MHEKKGSYRRKTTIFESEKGFSKNVACTIKKVGKFRRLHFSRRIRIKKKKKSDKHKETPKTTQTLTNARL